MYDLVKFYMIRKKRSSLLVNKHTDRNTSFREIDEPMDLGPKGSVDPEPRVQSREHYSYSTNVFHYPSETGDVKYT